MVLIKILLYRFFIGFVCFYYSMQLLLSCKRSSNSVVYLYSSLLDEFLNKIKNSPNKSHTAIRGTRHWREVSFNNLKDIYDRFSNMLNIHRHFKRQLAIKFTITKFWLHVWLANCLTRVIQVNKPTLVRNNIMHVHAVAHVVQTTTAWWGQSGFNLARKAA